MCVPTQLAHAMAAGKVTKRWAHTYTGNDQRETAGAWAELLFAPMPTTPHTSLSRCLTGVTVWEDTPRATVWLMRACRMGTAAVERAEFGPIAEHRVALLRIFANFEAHLRSMAHMNAVQTAVLKRRWLDGYTTRSELAIDPTLVVPRAAKAALEDNALWLHTPRTETEQAAFDLEAIANELFESELLTLLMEQDEMANRKVQVLHFHCETHGLDPTDGKMRECMYCQDGDALVSCSEPSCVCVAHLECLHMRGIDAPAADGNDDGWLCEWCVPRVCGQPPLLLLSHRPDDPLRLMHDGSGIAGEQGNENVDLSPASTTSQRGKSQPNKLSQKSRIRKPKAKRADPPLPWKVALLDFLRAGQSPAFEELVPSGGSLPPDVHTLAMSFHHSPAIVLAPTPCFFQRFDVPAHDLIQASKLLLQIIRDAQTKLRQHSLHTELIGPTMRPLIHGETKYAWYHLTTRAWTTIRDLAKATSASELKLRPKGVDAEMQRELVEALFEQCPLCSMPVLDPCDPGYVAKVQRIESIVVNDQPEGDAGCCSKCANRPVLARSLRSR